MTRFAYIRNIYGMPRMTIATKLDMEKNQIIYGYSICSHRDQFKKNIGRLIAEGRLLKAPNYINTDLTDIKAHQITKLVVEDIKEETTHAPKIQKLLLDWLYEYQYDQEYYNELAQQAELQQEITL